MTGGTLREQIAEVLKPFFADLAREMASGNTVIASIPAQRAAQAVIDHLVACQMAVIRLDGGTMTPAGGIPVTEIATCASCRSQIMREAGKDAPWSAADGTFCTGASGEHIPSVTGAAGRPARQSTTRRHDHGLAGGVIFP